MNRQKLIHETSESLGTNLTDFDMSVKELKIALKHSFGELLDRYDDLCKDSGSKKRLKGFRWWLEQKSVDGVLKAFEIGDKEERELKVRSTIKTLIEDWHEILEVHYFEK